MTLQDVSAPDAAARTIELLAAVEDVRDSGAEACLEAVSDVLRRWHETPDEALRLEIDAILRVLDKLADVIDASDADAAAQLLNAILQTDSGPPRLVNEPGWGWHLHVDRADSGWAGWLAATSAFGLAVLLALHGRVIWGRCASADCRRPFIDRGRRGPQRFCTSTCATRERVRRHRSR